MEEYQTRFVKQKGKKGRSLLLTENEAKKRNRPSADSSCLLSSTTLLMMPKRPQGDEAAASLGLAYYRSHLHFAHFPRNGTHPVSPPSCGVLGRDGRGRKCVGMAEWGQVSAERASRRQFAQLGQMPSRDQQTHVWATHLQFAVSMRVRCNSVPYWGGRE